MTTAISLRDCSPNEMAILQAFVCVCVCVCVCVLRYIVKRNL